MHTLGELAKIIDAKLVGDESINIAGAASLGLASNDQLSYIVSVKHKQNLLTSKAGVVILNEDLLNDCPTNALVVNDDVYLAGFRPGFSQCYLETVAVTTRDAARTRRRGDGKATLGIFGDQARKIGPKLNIIFKPIDQCARHKCFRVTNMAIKFTNTDLRGILHSVGNGVGQLIQCGEGYKYALGHQT